MTPPKTPWTWCNRVGCDTKLLFARRNGRTLPYDYDDRPPFSEPGLQVLIDGIAFTPLEAIEHYQTLGEGRTEEKARELVAGHPFHRPHFCDHQS